MTTGGVLAALCRSLKGGLIELVSAIDPGEPFAGAIARSVILSDLEAHHTRRVHFLASQPP